MGFFTKKSTAAPMRIIIVGAGEVGYHIARRLSQEDKQVVVIDVRADALKRLTDIADVQTIQGSGSSPRVLDEAGIHDASIVLAVTDSDEINLIACFFANLLSPTALKLARLRNEEYTLYRDAFSSELLNISTIINPEVEVVKSIDNMITVPGALELMEFAAGRVKMVGMRVGPGPLTGVGLPQLRSRMGDLAFILAALVRGERVIIPTGKDSIQPDDLVYFVCQEQDLPAVSRAFGMPQHSVKDVLVIGGGSTGLRLATRFEDKGYHVKLVDKDAARCEVLAERLNRTIVLHGDGTDQELLAEENVSGMDLVVSVTGDEETNILSSLLAKSMGARKTITRINKTAYLPLLRAIGIEHSFSPRLSAVNSILRYVRRGKILSSVAIKGDQAEALEAVVQEGSELAGIPLKDLDFPAGALILCILRGDNVLLPGGETRLQPGDRVILIALRTAMPKVEQALSAVTGAG
ncbi:MAG: Trk system potassium transporter TrkA [Desulfovibrio sp.]|nr:Trk system potassium transporter TrkA [Desulfovibrio sp.]